MHFLCKNASRVVLLLLTVFGSSQLRASSPNPYIAAVLEHIKDLPATPRLPEKIGIRRQELTQY